MTKTPHDHRPHGDGRIREGDEALTSNQCGVKGCKNTRDQGAFVGPFCAPCDHDLRTGNFQFGTSVVYEQAHEIERLRAELQGVRLGAEGMGWAPRSPVETRAPISKWPCCPYCGSRLEQTQVGRFKCVSCDILRKSAQETGPKPDAEKAPVTSAEMCPTWDQVQHKEHNGKCVYCGAPMPSQSKASAPLCKCGRRSPHRFVEGECGEVKAPAECKGCKEGWHRQGAWHWDKIGHMHECTAPNGKGDGR